MTEDREYLKNRIYYAAKEGLAMPLFAFLSECPKSYADELLNEVSFKNSQDAFSFHGVFVLLRPMASLVFGVCWQMNKIKVKGLLDNIILNPVSFQKVIEDDGQQCTPLIIAARYGHDKVIKMLLSKFNPDLEQEGIVKFDGFVIEGASALWCAAGAGMYKKTYLPMTNSYLLFCGAY